MKHTLEAMTKHSQAVFSEVLEAHSEAVFSEVLEAAAKFNVCQHLEARVWHHLTLELGVTCRRSECSSRNVYSAISLLRLSKERRIVEVSAVHLRWVELRVAELCWLRRRNEIDIRL